MRIAIYADRDHFARFEGGDTSYLHDALSSCFDVSLHWSPDANLSRSADVVFVRFPRARPAPIQFLRDLRVRCNKLIINSPETLQRFRSKHHLRLFPDLTVPTIITRSHETILRFARKHGVIVLKPLEGHGGEGIVRIDYDAEGKSGLRDLVEEHTVRYGTPVVQPFIERIREWGDKRINVFAHEPISAVRTLPAADSFICHRSAGGREVPTEVSNGDTAILDRILPFLRENHIWWAGIDVIGPYLGEINVASPMMIRRADEAHGDTRGIDAVVTHLRRHARRHGL